MIFLKKRVCFTYFLWIPKGVSINVNHILAIVVEADSIAEDEQKSEKEHFLFTKKLWKNRLQLVKCVRKIWYFEHGNTAEFWGIFVWYLRRTENHVFVIQTNQRVSSAKWICETTFANVTKIRFIFQKKCCFLVISWWSENWSNLGPFQSGLCLPPPRALTPPTMLRKGLVRYAKG